MCRILFLKGHDTTKAIDFVQAFTKSGARDDRFGKLVRELGIPKLNNQHIHGWGYLLITRTGISNYMTSTFIADDTEGVKKLESELRSTKGEFCLFAEIRVTDKGYVSAFNAHPFTFSNKAGDDGYLFHNGFLDGEIIAKELGLNMNNYRTKNDSLFLAHYFSENLAKNKTVKESLQLPEGAISTTYNIMLFVHDRDGKYNAYIYPHIKKSALDKNWLYEANKLVTYASDGLFYAGSSTIADYLDYEFIDAENDKLINVPIDFIHEYNS